MSKIEMELNELPALAGHKFEPSEWILIDQARINDFADCTEDHQFIHVDPERAAHTPLGGTVAHGFLVLALLAPLLGESTATPRGATHGLNYGFNRVRFVAPVRSGKRVRAQVSLKDIAVTPGSRVLITHDVTIEIEGEDKPAIVAEWLTAWFV